MRTATRSRVGMGPTKASALTGDAVPRRSVSKRLKAANAPPQVTSRRVGSTHRKRLGRDKFLQLDSVDALARIEASSRNYTGRSSDETKDVDEQMSRNGDLG